MKVLRLFTLWGILVGFSCQKQETIHTELIETLEEVRKQVAPDRRVAVFDYKFVIDDGKTRITIETSEKEAKNWYDAKKTTDTPVSWHFLPDSTVLPNPYGLVANTVANIRGNPKYSSEQVTQAIFGTPVKILKKQGGWFLIQTPDKYLGWAETQIIDELSKEAFEQWKKEVKWIVLDETQVFTQPNQQSLIAKHVVEGAILRSVKTVPGGWLEVQVNAEKTGFIQLSKVKTVANWVINRKFSTQEMIETAKTLLGRPYMWGGTSPNGLDCSGFTKTVYYLHGFQLPRDASQQVFSGIQISTEAADYSRFQQGDFLFFGTRGNAEKPDKVVHVAIYMGDGKFINASGEIKIESLNQLHEDYNAYRFKTFLQARRMSPTEDPNGIIPIELAWEKM